MSAVLRQFRYFPLLRDPFSRSSRFEPRGRFFSTFMQLDFSQTPPLFKVRHFCLLYFFVFLNLSHTYSAVNFTTWVILPKGNFLLTRVLKEIMDQVARHNFGIIF